MAVPRVTVAEAVGLLSALEPTLDAPSIWSIDRLVRDTGLVAPVRACTGDTCGTRLFDAYDVASIRIYMRLRASDVLPRWCAVAAVAQHRDALRSALRAGCDLVLVVRGARSALVSPHSSAIGDALVALPILSVLDGVSEAVRELRAESPDVWTGTRFSRWSRVDQRAAVGL